ncbi:16S rRNA (guanine(966)-N(2))-methyltransferase RsmD [Oceanobacillus alkalisoli]|uniref:16S rRNA (guanine(966)-N(2))-methyltransferase RsmD n=1 Tax=Oceanobacillus alkalisoli TaxID=2925113 RepID=UPI001EE3A349|nr:16S rRNA (guanine(966)-N(2))-methyltransferase RsmD [Oceanobacillus alkalisoli]MCG5103595.1 16S rRNA (guanine(966)-N(2))-methyltransferase RsmD [Oceanobacillus alkalisoli]
MRVIAGKRKGQGLKAVPGSETRPTTDKIKEAIFQSIGPFFDGGLVLDLFAGSGSLGIEALSRGMDRAIFVDKQGKAIHTIKENLKSVKMTDQAEVFRADAFRALKAAAKRGLVFDLILLDPPYGKVNLSSLIQEITEHELIKQSGLIYCEHDPQDELPEDTVNLTIQKQEVYSSTIAVTIYRLN